MDDEWYRRRSERIFLHEASAGSSSSQTVPVTGLRSTGDERSLSTFPSKPFTKPQRTLSQELGLKALSASQKSELSVTLKTCLSENKQASNLKCHIHVKALHFSSSCLSCNWRFWSPLIKMHCSKKIEISFEFCCKFVEPITFSSYWKYYFHSFHSLTGFYSQETGILFFRHWC